MKNYLIYPTKKMYISQSYNGNYSHDKSSRGIPQDYPIDESCGSIGRDYFYCPCDEVIIKRIYGVGQSGTNTIWMESTSKVILANNRESFITIMVTHPNDDTLKNIKVGDKFKRGDQMFVEGDDGNATGNHFHISVSASKYISGGWQINNKGAWVIKGNPIKPENAFFIDSDFTTIIDSKGLKFKKLIQNIGNSVMRDETKKQIEIIVDKIIVRKSPNGETLGYVNNGIYDVLEEKNDGNNLWYRIDDNMWVLDNDGVETKLHEVKKININDIKNENEVLISENLTVDNVKKENIWQKIKRFFLNLFNI